jgi:glycosyltransferase involved in cell wall biosynthesis
MKIVFISLFREGFGGGEGRIAHEMAHYFAAHHDVVMMCPAGETGLYEQEDGLRVFGIRSGGEQDVSVPALSARNVSRIFDFLDEFSPDVIHAHEPALIGLVGQVWAKMYRVPFVHTSHVLPSHLLDFGTVDALNIRILRGSFASSLTRPMLLDFYENCDAIVALNRAVAEDLRNFGYTGRILRIPNGRDLSLYADCEITDPAVDEKTLLFVGYITERKNQVYLLQMMRHLPPTYRLLLIGKPLNPEYGEKLRAFCEEWDLETVEFTGTVPHERIADYLERTHVFVSASKMEVQSLVVIEALASGTPVVGLSNETVDELVDERVGFRLPGDASPRRFSACVERICHLAPADYRAMGDRARARVSELDWANVMALTVKAYRVLREKRPPVTVEMGDTLASLVSLLPRGEVRDVLEQEVRKLRQSLKERLRPPDTDTMVAKVKAVQRVPGSTWLWAALTIPASVIGYLLVKHFSSLFRSASKN